jgi:hypothetical protein
MNTTGMCPMVVLVAVLSIAPLWAQGTQDDTELAKKTQNPVADLISVPLQNNFNFVAGTKDQTIYVFNVQPVIPLKLTEDWNLITRIITPIINQPSLFEGRRERLRAGGHQPFVLPVASEARRAHLGCGADVHFADGDGLAAGQWSVEHGACAL